MASLIALTVVYITGVSSFSCQPGHFYRVDASAGAVTAQLPSFTDTHSTDWLIVKKSDSSANKVNVTPHSGEKMNGSTGPNQLTGHNQSRMYMPNTPSFFGSGWMSW